MKPVESPYSLEELLRALWNRKWIIIGLLAFGMIIGFTVFGQMKPKYEATSEILINTNKSENYMYTQNMMETYRGMLTSKTILDKVNASGEFNLTAEEYNDKVNVSMVSTSQLIKITVKSPNKNEPVKLTNRIVKVFQKEIQTYSKVNSVDILNVATETTGQNKRLQQLLSLLIGAIVGLLVGIIYSLLSEIYSTKVDSEAKVQRLNVPLLATKRREDDNDRWTYYMAQLLMNKKKTSRTTLLILNDTEPLGKDSMQLSRFLSNYQSVAILQKDEKQQLMPTRLPDSEVDVYTYSVDTPIKVLQQTYLELEQRYDVVLLETNTLDSVETVAVEANRTMVLYLVDAKKTSFKKAQSMLGKVSQLKMHILGIVIVK